MDPELIAALNRLADAHSRLADNVGRLADAFAYSEDKKADLTFAEGLVWQVSQLNAAVDHLAEKLPELPEGD